MLHFNYATLALNFVVIIVYTMLIDVNYLFIFAQFSQTIPSSFVTNIQLLLTHRSGCMRHMGHNLTAPDINNGHTAPLDRVTVIFFAAFLLGKGRHDRQPQLTIAVHCPDILLDEMIFNYAAFSLQTSQNYIQFSVISVRTIYIRVVYQRKWLHT
ncbi:MAG: hypothetical protein ACLSU2_05935 [Oscillospiraceae bacterium]